MMMLMRRRRMIIIIIIIIITTTMPFSATDELNYVITSDNHIRLE